MEVAEKVKKLMTERDLNQSDLAGMAGVSRQKMSLVLNGEAGLKPYQLLTLARGLGVDLEYLVDTAMNDPKPSSHLNDDERAILQVYRALRPQLDQAAAIRALSFASNAELLKKGTEAGSRSPVARAREDMKLGEVLSGQAARDAIAASTLIQEPLESHEEPTKKSAPSRGRRKA